MHVKLIWQNIQNQSYQWSRLINLFIKAVILSNQLALPLCNFQPNQQTTSHQRPGPGVAKTVVCTRQPFACNISRAWQMWSTPLTSPSTSNSQNWRWARPGKTRDDTVWYTEREATEETTLIWYVCKGFQRRKHWQCSLVDTSSKKISTVMEWVIGVAEETHKYEL